MIAPRGVAVRSHSSRPASVIDPGSRQRPETTRGVPPSSEVISRQRGLPAEGVLLDRKSLDFLDRKSRFS